MLPGSYPFLADYYSILYGKYSSFIPYRLGSPACLTLPQKYKILETEISGPEDLLEEEINRRDVQLNLDGEIDLNLSYGKTYPLKEGVVVGAGSEGINQGLKYTLIQRILFVGSIADRLFIEIDYDSTRTEEGLQDEKNLYSLVYRGKKDEFLQEASIGNKYLSIDGSRYIPIDEGNQDSFALRTIAGTGDVSIQGLVRYDVALEGKKQFQGMKKSVDMRALDVDYAKGKYFHLPDSGIDENSLLLYKTAEGGFDLVVDGKKFTLLGRGVDYDFDNTSGFIYLYEYLETLDELIVYYEKGSLPVGNGSLGQNAIINEQGVRVHFNSSSFPDYFDATLTYLYLKKNGKNSYWELRNIYPLDEYEGNTLSNVQIEILYTSNGGLNSNYDSLLQAAPYEVDLARGIFVFTFDDGTGFYPRPFPGENPYDPGSAPYAPSDPRNPFDPDNPIYGGISYPLSEQSINTIRLQYSYNAESYFLDFNLVPGSVSVTINGVDVDPKDYDIDYEMGIITFEQGVVGPSSTIDITYRYSPLGGGDESFFTALGVGYENGFINVRNLAAYRTAFKGREAPGLGSEGSSSFSNSTALALDIVSDEDEEGLYADIAGEFAFAYTNKNIYGSAIIADMEKDRYVFQVSTDDGEWFIASKSFLLPDPPHSLTLATRGDVLYKNYWEKTPFSGYVLKSIESDIPADHIFPYSEKAGPYNSADYPSDGEESSLVIDYEFLPSSTDAYVSVVTPLGQENLSEFERFNILLRAKDITGSTIRVYVELLKVYDEDLNGNSLLDGEDSINDAGFEITPVDGGSTVIGSSREGKSNGSIESEDLNENGYLDFGSEEGVAIVQPSGASYVVELTPGTGDWKYISYDILDLIDNNKATFQYCNALRITLLCIDSPLTESACGKLLVNKVWFSGSTMVNRSKQYLNISEVSVNEDSEVEENAFSETYPDLYDELHGDAAYRAKNGYEEAVLRCTLLTALPAGDQATVSRRFSSPADLSYYEELRIFAFIPPSQTIPSSLRFTIAILSSENQRLEISISHEMVRNGWNEFCASLDEPYTVTFNGAEAKDMSRTGSLAVVTRVSEVRFSLEAESASINTPFEFWLDEWYVSEVKRYFDKAFFAEGNIGYNGEVVSLFSFPLVEDPSLSLGYERKEGSFHEDFSKKSDKYFTGIRSRLFQYLGTRFYMSRESITPLRNKDELPAGLSPDGSTNFFSHGIELDLGNPYLPVLTHAFEWTQSISSEVEVTKEDYLYKKLETYDESLEFGERIDFPFGLSQAYSFYRTWFHTTSFTAIPALSEDLSEQQSASLSQIHDIGLTFTWQRNSSSISLKRDETYTGLYVPYSDEWFRSYLFKLDSLFGGPSASLENAVIFSREDSLELGVNIPLKKRLGFSTTYTTSFTESHFLYEQTYRDTLVQDTFHVSFPFYFFGNDRIEIIPQLDRSMKGDYKEVSESIEEGELIVATSKYLFMPPFYYFFWRINDYKAVDIYESSESIRGNTTNTLSHELTLTALLEYDAWFIPSSTSVSVGGETKRDGANYTQKRSVECTVQKSFDLRRSEAFFDKSLLLSLLYLHERDYATKVITNSYETEWELNLLKTEWRGVKIGQSFTYKRERQKREDERLILIPGHEEQEVPVSEKPYRDTVEHEARFHYLWEIGARKHYTSTSGDGIFSLKAPIRNEEKCMVENSYIFTDREKASAFSNLLFRITLEHVSSYNLTENSEAGLYIKSVIGVEEKILPPSVEGNRLPSAGFELGAFMKILF